jgi:hypothetical protein
LFQKGDRHLEDSEPVPFLKQLVSIYAEALGLDRESSEWFEFFDLASAARGEIPSDLLSDAQVVERLPVMFQAMREMDPVKLDQFIDLVRRS